MSKRRSKFSKEGQAIDGPFVAHPLAMRSSSAWWALSGNDRKVLDCIELAHMKEGGAKNGRLVVPYNVIHDLTGLRRDSISLALRRLETLGFVEVRRFGYQSGRGGKPANAYRLTYVFARDEVRPGRDTVRAPARTDEWQRFKTERETHAALDKLKADLRREKAERNRKRGARGSLTRNIESSPAERTMPTVPPSGPCSDVA